MITKGDGERGATDQELGINIHTTEHKIGRQQGPTVEHRKIHSATYSNLYGEKKTSFVVQSVKNLPAMQEIWVRSLGRDDSLEKEMETHSSILSQRIPWAEEPGTPVHGVTRVGHDLGSITNKASEGDGIPVELFQILKDDSVKVLHSICQQI